MPESLLVSPPHRHHWLGSGPRRRSASVAPPNNGGQERVRPRATVGRLLTFGVSCRVRADLRRGTPVRPSRSALGGKTLCTHDTACSVPSSRSPHSAGRSSRRRSSRKLGRPV